MNKDSKITVAVIIPCRNEKKYIDACVRSVMAQSYPKEFTTVLVVDGMSDDGTLDIIQTLTAEFKNVKYIKNEAQVTPTALNLGLKKAQADIKIIFGAHANMHPNYVEECIKCLMLNTGAGCAGGVINNTYVNGISKAIGAAMASPFGVGGAHFRTGGREGFVDTVAFGAYKKEVFETIGYFDEELVRNQDDEFNYRLIKGGYKIFLSKKIESEYVVRASFKKLALQYYQYGYWKVYVNKKHGVVTTLRQLAPFGLVMFLITSLLLSLFCKTFLVVAGLTMTFYLLTSFLFAFTKTNSAIQIARIIFSFAILHFCYGWGYLVGIVQFLFLSKKPTNNSKVLSR